MASQVAGGVYVPIGKAIEIALEMDDMDRDELAEQLAKELNEKWDAAKVGRLVTGCMHITPDIIDALCKIQKQDYKWYYLGVKRLRMELMQGGKAEGLSQNEGQAVDRKLSERQGPSNPSHPSTPENGNRCYMAAAA